jgi:hypothetical protein
MHQIQDTTHVEVGEGYDVSVISGARKTWVVLTSSRPGDLLYFWSRKIATGGEVVPPEAVVEMVRERLHARAAGNMGEYHCFTFWPPGWDFWGLGIPAEISDYFRSQFRRDLLAAQRRVPASGEENSPP